MRKFRERPYNLLLLSAILILIASFFSFEQTLDIHLHDTYFVITLRQIFRYATIALLVLWVLYKLTNRSKFSK